MIVAIYAHEATPLTVAGQHPWLRIQLLLRSARCSIVAGSVWEPTPWRAVQRAAWEAIRRTDDPS